MMPQDLEDFTDVENIVLISGAGDGDTGGGICYLEAGKVQTIDRVSTAGITIFNGRLARLLRTSLSAGGGEILVYDGRGISHYLRVDELADPHYMAWDGEHLIVSSTGTNSLIWITLGGEVVRQWRAPGEDDSWHLNDVGVVNERLYACAFGRFEHYRGYKDSLAAGTGIVFDVATGRDVVSGLNAPHSPRYFDGAWTVCDSLRNAVVQFGEDGRRKKEIRLRGFTRGMAVTDKFLFVGESAQRNTGTGSETGSVAILRRDDFSVVGRYEVPFREVSEVVVVPRAVVNAVKIGFRTNPLRAAECDQLQLFREVGIEPKRLWAISERLLPEHCKVQVRAQIPAQFQSGKTALVECTVENLSEAFLCSELPFPIFLSYRWMSNDQSGTAVLVDGIRTRLPQTLPPAGSMRLRADIQAPDLEGEFELVVTLVQEHVAWFDHLDPSNAFRSRVRVARFGSEIEKVVDAE